MEALIQAIVEWCSQNGEMESPFATPHPSHYIYTEGFFDFLSEKSGISQAQISEWFAAAQQRRAWLKPE